MKKKWMKATRRKSLKKVRKKVKKKSMDLKMKKNCWRIQERVQENL